MNYLIKQSKEMLINRFRAAGFSIGEAESRIEGLESVAELEYLMNYMNEHEGATVDELRFVHTGLIRKHEATMIGSRKKNILTDQESVQSELLLRQAKICWQNKELESYLRQIESLRSLEQIEFRKPITFFVGENGCGKSTLLEAIAIAAGYNPEGGSKNYEFSTCDTHSNLHEAISLVKGARKPEWGIFLRAETFYNMATEAERLNDGRMFKRYGGRSFHEQSHGESFYSMLETDITDNGLYFFDEPEAALSPRRQLNLLGLLHKYANEGAQFVIATHSPILLACPDACIYEFSKAGVREIEYEDTDIYKIVSGFVNDRDKMLRDVIIDERKY